MEPIKKQLWQLQKDKRIKSIKRKRSNRYELKTEDIVLTDPVGTSKNLGSFTVVIDLLNNTWDFPFEEEKCVDYSGLKSRHPHIYYRYRLNGTHVEYYGGRGCVGSYRYPMVEALRHRDLITFCEILLDFLNSVDRGGHWRAFGLNYSRLSYAIRRD